MTTLALVIGWLVIATVAVTAAAAMIYVAACAVERTLLVHGAKVEQLTIRQAGHDLMTAAWWFSENKAAMDAIVEVARPMLRGVNPAQVVDESRETWRKKHAVPKTSRESASQGTGRE